ncbi:hypothetical protein ANO11243_079220 [Dothideomycetidae sp. 11243]|nr:hypothetical protein ANO11243_079220 [fungal sp. No.11243]
MLLSKWLWLATCACAFLGRPRVHDLHRSRTLLGRSANDTSANGQASDSGIDEALPEFFEVVSARAAFPVWRDLSTGPSHSFPTLPLKPEVRLQPADLGLNLSKEDVKKLEWDQLSPPLQQVMIARFLELDGAGYTALLLTDNDTTKAEGTLRADAYSAAEHLDLRVRDLVSHFSEDFGLDHAVPAAMFAWSRQEELKSPLLLLNEGQDLAKALQFLYVRSSQTRATTELAKRAGEGPKTRITYHKSLDQLRQEEAQIGRHIQEVEELDRVLEQRGVPNTMSLENEAKILDRIRDNMCAASIRCKMWRTKLKRVLGRNGNKIGNRPRIGPEPPKQPERIAPVEPNSAPKARPGQPPRLETDPYRGPSEWRRTFGRRWYGTLDGAADSRASLPLPKSVAELKGVEKSSLRSLGAKIDTYLRSTVEEGQIHALWDYKYRPRPQYESGRGAHPAPPPTDENIGPQKPNGPEKPATGPEKPLTGPETPPTGPEKPPAAPEKPPAVAEKPPPLPEEPPTIPPEQGLIKAAPNSLPAAAAEEEAERVVGSIGQKLGSDLSTTISKELAKDAGKQGWRPFASLLARVPESWLGTGTRVASVPMLESLGPIVSVLSDPIFWVIDIATIVGFLPPMIIDMIDKGVHYHDGKCLKDQNVCVSNEDHKHHKCEMKYGPCRGENDLCKYRAVLPANVICPWYEFDIWNQARHLSATHRYTVVRVAHYHLKQYNRWATKLRQCEEQFKQHCEPKPKHKHLCRKTQDQIYKAKDKMAKHEPYMDYLKTPKLVKQAKKKWEQAEKKSEKLKQRHDETNARTQDLAQAERTRTDSHKLKHLREKKGLAVFKEYECKQDLLKTIKAAQTLHYQSDPVGITRLMVDRVNKKGQERDRCGSR